MTKGRILSLAAVTFVGLVGLAYWCIGPYTVRVSTGAMAPTIHQGDHVWVNSIVGTIKRGDLVMFRYPRDPTQTYIKRVIAVGGDLVQTSGVHVFVNGEPVAEQRILVAYGSDSDTLDEVGKEGAGPYSVYYVGSERRDGPSMFGPEYAEREAYRVPDDTFFVMGDNRDNSEDSRYWGPVPRANVIGRPMYVYAEEHDGTRTSIYRSLR